MSLIVVNHARQTPLNSAAEKTASKSLTGVNFSVRDLKKRAQQKSTGVDFLACKGFRLSHVESSDSSETPIQCNPRGGNQRFLMLAVSPNETQDHLPAPESALSCKLKVVATLISSIRRARLAASPWLGVSAVIADIDSEKLQDCYFCELVFASVIRDCQTMLPFAARR